MLSRTEKSAIFDRVLKALLKPLKSSLNLGDELLKSPFLLYEEPPFYT
jgi:hypothetical protein